MADETPTAPVASDPGAELKALLDASTLPALERETLALSARSLLAQIKRGVKVADSSKELLAVVRRLRETQAGGPQAEGARKKPHSGRGRPRTADRDEDEEPETLPWTELHEALMARATAVSMRLIPDAERAARAVGVPEQHVGAVANLALAADLAPLREGTERGFASSIALFLGMAIERLTREIDAVPLTVLAQTLPAIGKIAQDFDAFKRSRAEIKVKRNIQYVTERSLALVTDPDAGV